MMGEQNKIKIIIMGEQKNGPSKDTEERQN